MFSPDGKFLAAGAKNGTFTIMDHLRDVVVQQICGPVAVTAILWPSTPENKLFIAYADGGITVYDPNFEDLDTPSGRNVPTGTFEAVTSFDCDVSKQTLAATIGGRVVICSNILETSCDIRCVPDLPQNIADRSPQPVIARSAYFSKNGAELIICYAAHDIVHCSTQSMTVLYHRRRAEPISRTVMSSDREYVLSLDPHEEDAVGRYDVASNGGYAGATYYSDGSENLSIALIPDNGEIFVGLRDGTAKIGLWPPEQQRLAHGDAVQAVAAAQTQGLRCLATASETSLKMRRLHVGTTGQQIAFYTERLLEEWPWHYLLYAMGVGLLVNTLYIAHSIYALHTARWVFRV